MRPTGDHETNEGVQVDLVSGARLAQLTSMEKIRLILDGVHAGHIVILEEGLIPEEESKLIEMTMSEIDPDQFSGIEIETYPSSRQHETGLIHRLLGRRTNSKLTVIGPADQVHTLHKDQSLISTVVSKA